LAGFHTEPERWRCVIRGSPPSIFGGGLREKNDNAGVLPGHRGVTTLTERYP